MQFRNYVHHFALYQKVNTVAGKGIQQLSATNSLEVSRYLCYHFLRGLLLT